MYSDATIFASVVAAGSAIALIAIGCLQKKLRVGLFILSTVFVLIPFSGAGPGVLLDPIFYEPLPTLPIDERQPILYRSASVVYQIAELPLYLVTRLNSPIQDALSFRGEGPLTLRPIMVVGFWLGVTGVSAIAWIFYRRTRKIQWGVMVLLFLIAPGMGRL